MEMIILSLLSLANTILIGVVFYTVKRSNRSLREHLRQIETATKDMRVIRQQEYNVGSAPNEATQKPKDNEEMMNLDEAKPWSLPDDIKIEVEGGDGHVPPEFQGL